MEKINEIEKVETITPEQVAKVLGKGVEFVRAGLRQNRFPFGTAVESKSGQWNYIIIKSKFLEYVKWKEWEKMSKQMKKYCIIGKAVCNFTSYVIPTVAVIAAGALVIMKIFIG